jgi:serine/threonine protein kinase
LDAVLHHTNIVNLVELKNRNESPFYFKGQVSDMEKNPIPLFCKVWRNGDEYTIRRHIILECKYLTMAYDCGVPCPKVLEGLSSTDLEYDSNTFHVLVMKYHNQDDVSENDLTLFARRLISAVLKLHKHKILHCDIKRLNIAWDSSEKSVRLLDFGHAQNMTNAKAYRGTQGYEAPEVIRGLPHTQHSDAYCVGLTLLQELKQYDDDAHHRIKKIATELSLESLSDRLSLGQALEHLQQEKQVQTRCLEHHGNGAHC